MSVAETSTDTILALASARVGGAGGAGARAVLRLSGPESVEAIESITDGKTDLRTSRGFHGVRLSIDGAPVWAMRFRAPRSYTREDVVELHVPASAPLLARLTRALLAHDGVRFAAPGEFTLRAFQSGRIDLSQAEAVAQLIHATGEDEARAARRGLVGELGGTVRRISERLTEALALIEAGIDFADEDLPELASSELLRRLDEVAASISELRRSSSLRVASEGAYRVVLAGFPNAGKSSLLNALLERPLALVSEFEGTTRDPVRGSTNEPCGRVEWCDLAGSFRSALGESGAPPQALDATGLDRRLSERERETLSRLNTLELEAADLALWVVDGADDARREASLAEFERLDAARRLLVVSKGDLLDGASGQGRHFSAAPIVVSARTGQGLGELRERVLARLAPPEDVGEALERVESPRFLVSAHQEAALDAAEAALERAREATGGSIGPEFAAADVREALHALADLTGKVTPDDVLGVIFSRFCVGK